MRKSLTIIYSLKSDQEGRKVILSMNEATPKDGSQSSRLLIGTALFIAGLGAAARIVFAATLPLFENDATILFQAARETIAGRGLSMVQTLPALILAGLFRLTGESLFISTLPNLAGGVGSIILCYYAGKSISSKSAGAVAAMLCGATPLALAYSSITKPYSLLSFFILAAVCLWHIATSKCGRGAAVYAALSGLTFAAAFACHTFAAFAAFPLAGFFIAGLFAKKHRRLLMPSLVAGLTFGAGVSAVIAWRFPVFGWSIFNDYVTDWRFEIATLVWSARWEGLTNLFAAAPFAGLGGLALFTLRDKESKNARPLIVYFIAVIALNALVYCANPVNHFPRVLLPAAAPLSILAGIGLTRKGVKSVSLIVVALIAVLGSAWLLAEISAGRALWIGLLHDVSAAKFTFLCVFVFAVVFCVNRFAPQRTLSTTARCILIGLIGLCTLEFAIFHTHAALGRQADYFQGRLKSLAACDSGSGTLGGGDIAHLLLPGPNNYSWLTDLPDELLTEVFTVGLLPTLQKAGVGCVVVAWLDPEGEQAMILGYAKARDLPHAEGVNVFQELEDNPEIIDIYATDKYSSYVMPWFEKTPHEFAQRIKAYSPICQTNIWPTGERK